MASQTKRSVKSDSAAKSANGRAKNALRAPQLRILACLARHTTPLSRSQIAEKAPVDQASCVEYLGSADDEIRKANDAKHFPSLVSLGLVKHQRHEGEPVTYTITAKGKAAAAKV